MHDDPRIERHIVTILAGSGLSMDRRAEVAEELRCHFSQSIAGKRESGLSEQEALASAIDAFGSPGVIRRQLRRQQRMLDRRQASDKVRRLIWFLLVWAVAFATLLVVCAPEANSLFDRCLTGVELFAILFMLMVWAAYVSEIFNVQVERRRPRVEYVFFRSFLRGMLIMIFGAVSAIPFVMGIFAVLAPLLNARWRSADPSALGLWHNFSIAWMEFPGRNFGLCVFGVVAFGLSIALHEHSRCIDEPDIPATV